MTDIRRKRAKVGNFKGRPRIPGWYWVRGRFMAGARPRLFCVEVVKDLMALPGDNRLYARYGGGELALDTWRRGAVWHGPVTPPIDL